MELLPDSRFFLTGLFLWFVSCVRAGFAAMVRACAKCSRTNARQFKWRILIFNFQPIMQTGARQEYKTVFNTRFMPFLREIKAEHLL